MYVPTVRLFIRRFAGMAELADAPDLGSGSSQSAGSIPVARTTKKGL